MQAGGRRFDPVILHQGLYELYGLYGLFVLFISKRHDLDEFRCDGVWILTISLIRVFLKEKIHGCSLTIHRVESKLPIGEVLVLVKFRDFLRKGLGAKRGRMRACWQQ